jgi:hypothetical protein
MIVLVSCDSCCFSKKYRFLFSDKFDFAGDVNKFDFVGGEVFVKLLPLMLLEVDGKGWL